MPRGCALVLVVSLGAACGDDRSSGALDAAPDAPADAALDAAAQRFSFFVTSLATMRLQAGSQHVARGPGGGPVHAIDRVGDAPGTTASAA